jgi:hypothetical protein
MKPIRETEPFLKFIDLPPGFGLPVPITARVHLSGDAKTSPIADIEKLDSHWWPHLDDAGKVEITPYFLRKTGAGVS